MADFSITRAMRRHDAGLVAVARVRAMHEEAARHELQLAVAMLNRYLTQKTELRAQLGGADAALEGPIRQVLSARAAVERVMDAIRYTDERIVLAQAFVDDRRSIWESRRTELSAVEKLLVNREKRRAAERARKEARDLDDIAGQGWLRQRTADVPGVGA